MTIDKNEMFNKHDIARDACQLFGVQAHKGYDWWWHSFTGYDAETGAAKPFFIEFFLCNPALGEEAPVFGQLHRFWGWKKIKVDWGKDFTSPWVWLSSSNLTSELTGKKLTNSVFDIGGGLIDRIHAENVGCEYGEYSL